jgi:hypothetical protein
LTGSEVYQDAVKVGGLTGLTSGGTWKFGSIGGIDSTLAFVGEIADVMVLARAVSVDEMLGYVAGPTLQRDGLPRDGLPRFGLRRHSLPRHS